MEKYLPKLRKSELEILDEIVRICDKYKIKYFLSGGTLLGAVRHKGFIPWDDDIDIGMLRNDFNKFIKVCKSELNRRFLLDCYETNKDYMLPFAKVRIKNSLMLEKSAINRDNNPGIWVDIFIFDDTKELNIKKILKQKRLHERYITLISLKQKKNYYNGKKWKKNIYELILKFIPYKFLVFLSNHNLSKYNSNDPKYIIDFSSFYEIKKEIFEVKKIFPLKKIKFEGKEYNVPKDYSYVLSKKYGDYMQLPPLDKRRSHPPLIIRFEDGEEIKFKEGKIDEK